MAGRPDGNWKDNPSPAFLRLGTLWKWSLLRFFRRILRHKQYHERYNFEDFLCIYIGISLSVLCTC